MTAADRGESLLLIEDSPLQARLVRELLAEGGESRPLEWEDTLAKGLARLARGGIGLVLLDLTLPDSWGLETFRAVRATVPSVPVLLLASRTDDDFLDAAAREGVRDYLPKDGLDERTLAEAVRRAMGG